MSPFISIPLHSTTLMRFFYMDSFILEPLHFAFLLFTSLRVTPPRFTSLSLLQFPSPHNVSFLVQSCSAIHSWWLVNNSLSCLHFVTRKRMEEQRMKKDRKKRKVKEEEMREVMEEEENE